MERKFYILFLFACMTNAIHGQIKVYSNNNVSIASPRSNTNNKLTISDKSIESTKYNILVEANTYSDSLKDFNIGIDGFMRFHTPINSCRTIGVRGIAGNATNGYNYGVLGGIEGDNNGAGIFGTTNNYLGLGIVGKYAGYFNGETYVDGKLSVRELFTLSDERVKCNIMPISNREDVCVLDNILRMNVIEYNYKDSVCLGSMPDSVSLALYKNDYINSKRHVGLSAQELLDIYPNIVERGQNGYFSVNYLELIPILIKSIQELQLEIDMLKSGDMSFMMSKALSRNNTTGMSENYFPMIMLGQNRPNPFKEYTIIEIEIPEIVNDAFLCIYSLDGQLLEKHIVNDRGNIEYKIDASSLDSGIYLYGINIDGKIVGVKKMIVDK